MSLLDWIETVGTGDSQVADNTGPSVGHFIQSKFDNISLMGLIIFLVCLLTWADKHNNGDYVKWLEVFSAGIGGAYLGLITASRQAWSSQTKGGNGNGNGAQSNGNSGTVVASTTASGVS